VCFAIVIKFYLSKVRLNKSYGIPFCGLTVSQKYLTITPSIHNKEKIMQTTISSKYQVVIPKPAREHLNLKPKQKLTVIEKDKMLILIPHVSLEELRGIASGSVTDDYREKKDRL
jgi:AbrB family looped-hinge helix DNA binding protein